MTPVVRHSLFNATVRRLDDDLDLPRAALAGLDVDPDAAQLNTLLSRCIQVIDHVALGGRLVQPVFPAVG